MDYKQLLIKYIEHIECIEGINFIHSSQPDGIDILTSEECDELESLSKQYVEPDYSETYKSIEEDIMEKFAIIKEDIKWQNATKYRFDEYFQKLGLIAQLSFVKSCLYICLIYFYETMGFITLKDGTVIHASLLNDVNVKPADYKISVLEFGKELKSKQIDIDKDIIDLVNNNFWNLV